MSQDIADFLRARYAEQREREIGMRRMLPEAPSNTMVREAFGDTYVLIGDDGEPSRPRMTVEDFNARYTEPAPDPCVLADLEARGQIIDEHGNVNDGTCGTCVDGHWGYPTHGGSSPQRHPCRTLRLLALPYADHSDYQQEWRP